jgi:hypothetical protein
MSSKDIDSIDEILTHLKEISNQLNVDATISDNFKLFREEYYLRNSEVREDLRDLKSELNQQKKGLNVIQNDVQEMKESFSGFKVEIQPLIEFKQMVSKQVIKYSSVAFFTLVAMTLGLNGIAI